MYWLWKMCRELSGKDYSDKEQKGKVSSKGLYLLLLLSGNVSDEGYFRKKSTLGNLTENFCRDRILLFSNSPFIVIL